MPPADVLLVSLGSTAGLRAADDALAESMRRAGASVEVAVARPVREWRTMAAIELAWALSARRAAAASGEARAVIYSASTAALLAPRPGAIRFDAPAAGNRPGRHGLWQRPVERRRLREASLLVPWSTGGLDEAPSPHADAVVVPVPVAASGPSGDRDIAAITYGAHPEKKGLDRVLAAWARAHREGEELVVAGLTEATWRGRAADGRGEPAAGRGESAAGRGHRAAPPGVRFTGMLSRDAYRGLLRRSRVFVTAPRREDYGIAQLEALADGCVLVTTPAPGPYAALPLARELDPRLVAGELTIRTALDDPAPGYAERAAELLRPWRPAEVDRVVADVLLPRLLD
jgi:hypothetical protein